MLSCIGDLQFLLVLGMGNQVFPPRRDALGRASDGLVDFILI
jgi:hypothetical protein